MQIDELPAGEQNQCPDMDMNRVVGTHDILMLCFDTLRYDVSKAEEAAGGTPVLNSHGGLWEKGMRREILLIPLILLFLQAFFLRRQSLIPCVAVNGCFPCAGRDGAYPAQRQLSVYGSYFRAEPCQ